MNDVKNKQERDPKYYVLDEKQRITIADVEFNEEIDRYMRGSGSIVPEGEVLLIQEDTRKLWVSTSKKSLISVLKNKKRDIYIGLGYIAKRLLLYRIYSIIYYLM